MLFLCGWDSKGRKDQHAGGMLVRPWENLSVWGYGSKSRRPRPTPGAGRNKPSGQQSPTPPKKGLYKKSLAQNSKLY